MIVTLDPTRMASAGVSIDAVQGVLTANNLTLPAGQLPTGTNQIPVSTSGSFTTLDPSAAVQALLDPPGGA